MLKGMPSSPQDHVEGQHGLKYYKVLFQSNLEEAVLI